MNREDERRQFNVRIPKDLINFLKVEAKNNHRTVVSQLIYVLRKEQSRVETEAKE